MIAASQHEQRWANEVLRLLHKLWHSTRARGVEVAAALALTLWPKVEFHRGSMDASFNQDFDVDTLRLQIRGGFEFWAGGGSLNVVNDRWDCGVELIRFPLLKSGRRPCQAGKGLEAVILASGALRPCRKTYATPTAVKVA